MPPKIALFSRPTMREIAASILHPQSSTSSHRTHRTLRNKHISSTSFPQALKLDALPRRHFSTSDGQASSRPSRSRDRGPKSSETTQTDFSALDVLGGTPAPSTAIDACLWDGFHLNNGVKIGNGAGVLLIGGEAFAWRPWEATSPPSRNSKSNAKDNNSSGGMSLLNQKGQWEVSDEAWGILELVYPKPDLLILGVGPRMAPLSAATRQAIARLGIRVEVQDTRNASAQFNLLATERGVGSVAAGLVPVGWREGKGIVSSS